MITVVGKSEFLDERVELSRLVKDRVLLEQVIGLYIRAFREPPWNETFHTFDSVLLEIVQELSNAGAALFIKRRISDGRVVSFGWGYPAVSCNALVEAKYTGKMTSIVQKILQEQIPNDMSFWYTSEVVTDPTVRGKGLATQIVLQQEAYAKQIGLKFVVLRTSSDSPMSYIAGVKAKMRQVIGPTLQNKDVTSGYEKRVLYVKDISLTSAQKDNIKLYRTILKLKTEKESKNFLRSLLTLSELKEVMNRWEIICLLSKKVAYKEIIDKTGASSTTIAKMSKRLHSKKYLFLNMAAVA